MKPAKRPKLAINENDNDSAGSSVEASGGHETATEGEPESLDEVELVFKPHPEDMTDGTVMKLPKDEETVRFLKTTSNATIDHLIKYLAVRLALDPDPEAPDQLTFCIFVSPNPGAPGQFLMLNGNETLYQIVDKYWRVNKPIEMYYTWKGSSEPAASAE